MGAIVEMDRARWQVLLTEVGAQVADPERPRATLYTRASEAEAAKTWPGHGGGDGHVCAALLQLCWGYQGAKADRRAILRPVLAAIAGEVAAMMGPPPEAAEAQADLGLEPPAPAASEPPAWTRRADCGTGG